MAGRSDVRASAHVWYPRNLTMEEWAVLGPGVNCYNMAPISIGTRAIVSQRAHLCGGTHDIDSEEFRLIMRPITIGRDVWVGAEAFVGPGAVLGEGAVLGARAVAFGPLEPWTVYTGNPAEPVRKRTGASEAVSSSTPRIAEPSADAFGSVGD